MQLVLHPLRLAQHNCALFSQVLKGVPVDNLQGWTPLMAALSNSQLDAASWLLSHGAEVNAAGCKVRQANLLQQLHQFPKASVTCVSV